MAQIVAVAAHSDSPPSSGSRCGKPTSDDVGEDQSGWNGAVAIDIGAEAN